MRLAGFLLLLSGWMIVLSAIILFPSAATRAVFVFAGVAVELLGLVLVFRSHLELRKCYRVADVDARGTATLEYSVTAMRNEQTRQISNALTQNLLSVDTGAGQGTIGVKLCGEFRCLLAKPCPILVGPPSAKSAASIVDVSQLVKAMTDFVGNTGAS